MENIARVSRLKLSVEENQLGGNSVSFVTVDSDSALNVLFSFSGVLEIGPLLSLLPLRAKYLLSERMVVVPKTIPTRIPTINDDVSVIVGFLQ